MLRRWKTHQQGEDVLLGHAYISSLTCLYQVAMEIEKLLWILALIIIVVKGGSMYSTYAMWTRGGSMCCICRLPNYCSNIIWPIINPTIVVGSIAKLGGAATYYYNITYVGGGCDEEVSWATQAFYYIPNGIICQNSTN